MTKTNQKPNQNNASEKSLNSNQKKNVVALKKVSASCQNIIKMIEDGATCYDILQQTRAVMGLLKGVQNRSMECSIEEFVDDSDELSNKQKMQKFQQIVKAVELFNK